MNIKPIQYFLRHCHFICILILFVLLLARDPFSLRTQIPNFEPYPDSFHYLVPARSIVSGNGPYLEREGRKLQPAVPMLYSLSLVPFFALNNDPRVVYFANITFAFVALTLFYVILRKLKIHRSIQFFVLFLYATNFYIYWYPTLAMAENLTLILFFVSALLILVKNTKKMPALAGMVAVGFYATKYANIPLTVGFGLLYALKILFSTAPLRVRIHTFITFAGAGIFCFSLLSFWEYYWYGKNILSSIFWVFTSLSQSKKSTEGSPSGAYFSLSFFPKNFLFHLNMILGKPTKMLWVFAPLLPMVVAVPGIAGLIATTRNATTRLFSSLLIILITANMLFLSTFYAPDARYFLFVIPSLLFGVALLLQSVRNWIPTSKKIIFTCILAGLLLIASVTSALRLKNQIGLNLRHSETPWYYISILELNTAVDALNLPEKPIVISSLPPYLVDFYSGGRYTVLPLHNQQEFRSNLSLVFGENDYSNLHELYRRELLSGKTVLVGKYGLGNESMLQDAFADLSNYFSVELIHSGCFELCNVYKLSLPATL